MYRANSSGVGCHSYEPAMTRMDEGQIYINIDVYVYIYMHSYVCVYTVYIYVCVFRSNQQWWR